MHASLRERRRTTRIGRCEVATGPSGPTCLWLVARVRSSSGSRRCSSSRHLSFDDGVYGADGGRDARRRPPVPRRLLVAGAAAPPAALRRRPRRCSGRWTRRACSRSRRRWSITIAVYLIARRVAGRRAGVIAAALATTSGSSSSSPPGSAATVPRSRSRRRRSRSRSRTASGRRPGVRCATGLLVGAACSREAARRAGGRRRSRARVLGAPPHALTCVAAAVAAVAVPLVLAAPWGYSTASGTSRCGTTARPAGYSVGEARLAHDHDTRRARHDRASRRPSVVRRASRCAAARSRRTRPPDRAGCGAPATALGAWLVGAGRASSSPSRRCGGRT